MHPSNNTYLGEIYDARREQPGGIGPDFRDTAWTRPQRRPEPVGRLQAEKQPPIRVTGKLKPVAGDRTAAGRVHLRPGQNFAGWAGLRVRGPAGTRIKLRLANCSIPTAC